MSQSNNTLETRKNKHISLRERYSIEDLRNYSGVKINEHRKNAGKVTKKK